MSTEGEMPPQTRSDQPRKVDECGQAEGCRLAEAPRETTVHADQPEVTVTSVKEGEIWSFSASGSWKNGWLRCGAAGYRSFIADVFEIKPRTDKGRWLELMGEVVGHPDSVFRIGAGCTHQFAHSGRLIVFANDRPTGYRNNKDSVTLTSARGGRRASAWRRRP